MSVAEIEPANSFLDCFDGRDLFGLSTPIAKGLLGVVSPQILAGLFHLGSGIGLALLRRIQSSLR
jgi:hypothetical protein